MKAKDYWRYNTPVTAFRNCPEDVAEGCGEIDGSMLDLDNVVPSVAARKNQTCNIFDDGIPEDQTQEQFFLTAANMHLELAKGFYELSQGLTTSVAPHDKYLPDVEIVTDENVANVRKRWAMQMGTGFIALRKDE
jgi:hypothetical protein